MILLKMKKQALKLQLYNLSVCETVSEFAYLRTYTCYFERISAFTLRSMSTCRALRILKNT